jgi:hypothetical protein
MSHWIHMYLYSKMRQNTYVSWQVNFGMEGVCKKKLADPNQTAKTSGTEVWNCSSANHILLHNWLRN